MRVRLLPWRPRFRDPGYDGFEAIPDLGGDDLIGIVLGVAAVVLVLPFVLVLLLFSLEIALVLLLAPLLVVVQLVGLRPWYLRVTTVDGPGQWVRAGSTREMLAARRYYRSLRP